MSPFILLVAVGDNVIVRAVCDADVGVTAPEIASVMSLFFGGAPASGINIVRSNILGAWVQQHHPHHLGTGDGG